MQQFTSFSNDSPEDENLFVCQFKDVFFYPESHGLGVLQVHFNQEERKGEGSK